jgi:surface polysaccharide O-acyltransferase-like enzyme
MIQKDKSKIKNQKERNPGIDLCRVLGMIDIIIYHIVIEKYLLIKYHAYNKQFKFLEILTQWHISNFGIISGIVGFKTNKYSNLVYLYLCVLFYSLTIHYIIIILLKNRISLDFNRNIQPRNYYFPLITNNYWYFSTYFVMYLFLPLINKGISLLDKVNLIIVILSLLGILFIWKDLMSYNPLKFCSDTSFTTLLVYYIIGAYIGKYHLNNPKKKNIFYYIICVVIFFFFSYITYFLSFYNGVGKCRLIMKKLFYSRSNSIVMILQSIIIVLIFIRIQYNKITNKIINFFGPFTFSVYLIHNHIDLRHKLFPYLFKNTSPSLSFLYLVILFISKGTLVFFSCIILDYFRFFLFKILRIRQICINIEKLIFLFFRNIINEKTEIYSSI